MKVFHNFEWTEILCWPNQINSTSSSPMLAFVDIDWMSVFLYFYWREFYFIRSPAATFYSGSYGDFSVTRWRRVDWCRARMPMWPKFLRKKKRKNQKKKEKEKRNASFHVFLFFFRRRLPRVMQLERPRGFPGERFLMASRRRRHNHHRWSHLSTMVNEILPYRKSLHYSACLRCVSAKIYAAPHPTHTDTRTHRQIHTAN